jgi:hypothetical protein
MITISILGLDQFVVGHYSKEHSSNLANLYESDESLLNFYSPNAMIFHRGVEQTSWNTIVIVRAPLKYKPFEKKVADYLLKTLSEVSINLEIEFEYFDSNARYEHVNHSYPRYIDESNIASSDIEAADPHEDGRLHEDEPDPRDRPDLDPNDPNQIFLGNAFEGFEEKATDAEKDSEKAPKPSNKKH